MEIGPQIFTAKVMHKRLFPKVNHFTYSVYYLVLPLEKLAEITSLKINRPGVISMHEKDYGARDGSAMYSWANQLLASHQLDTSVKHIMFVTMPRLFGYGFNPVSFYLCLDASRQLRAVISEVHNTFGECHSYIAAHPDHRILTRNDWLEAEKCFHVSPFMLREGHYRFRFATEENTLGIWIDYIHPNGNTQLLTALTGKLSPLTRQNLWKHFFTHPLVTIKTIIMIHWQALRLFFKGIRYIVKPLQKKVTITSNSDLTKM